MNVLGINQVPGMFAWMHDSAAALVKDGKLLAAAEEERFTRVRHAKGYPRRAIEYVLAAGRITKKEVEILAIAHDPWKFLRTWPANLHWRSLGPNLLNLGVFWWFKSFARSEFPNAKIVYVPHHLAHAASSYRCSGFAEANIITVDGAGETETFTFWTGKQGRIEKVWDIPLAGWWGKRHPQSIGLVYSRVTGFLSLGAHGEGKTMGLASYGRPVLDFSEILSIKNHKDFRIDRSLIAKKFKHLERFSNAEPLNEGQKDLAASLQAALEESILALAREAYGRSGIKKFCLAGGVALNCNTNSRILESDFCDEIFVQPAASDSGIAMGAALEAASLVEREPVLFRMETAYWGPEYPDEEIEALLQEAKVKFERHEEIERVTAKLLAEGNIVGWLQGRMELGPRALGNRSILADPTIAGINDRVNIEVKHREPWRPFAPIVTEEDGEKYFDLYANSPFMLLTFDVKKDWRDRLPAITHVDGSSRIQTLSERQNLRFYRLLREFEKLKEIPMLLNTSFNDAGEPIVMSPRDALRCFFSTGLDVLVMGKCVVRKNTQ